jgi:hypothetical protein
MIAIGRLLHLEGDAHVLPDAGTTGTVHHRDPDLALDDPDHHERADAPQMLFRVPLQLPDLKV